MALPKSLRDALTLPVFCAPMFLCSNAALAAACRRAGIIGSLTANHSRDLAGLEAELGEVRDAAARHGDAVADAIVGPLAVNLAPTMAPADFQAHLRACARAGAAIIVTSVGSPVAVAPMIRDLGLLHFHDVTTLRFAEKAAQAGVDGIIAIGAGGGGHSGSNSHLAFVPRIRELFDGVVVMAGGISTGSAVRAAEVMGADLAYMGTRFIATRESGAPQAYKDMLVSGDVEDVIFTRGVNGVNAMWLKASLRDAGLDPDHLVIPEGRSTGHLPPGKSPWRDIWSGGQGIGLIHDIPPTADLVRRLRAEYLAACALPDMAIAARAAQHRGQ